GEFVEAAKKIKEQYSHVRFQLLGKTDYDNPSHVKRATLDEWIKNGYIEYLGETTDVRPFIEKAVAVVLPSYREGIPNSLLEAMSMGKPIITTDVPGCRETIKDGINGLLIPHRDIESLANAMQTLISNPKLRIEMGKESRMFAEERFDVNKVNSLLLETMGITDF
ncbi:MAG: glycosyltransferase, partial [Bacteroidota bacterium]|nr:glycosyltransferase [Bacteroidota bacterium]